MDDFLSKTNCDRCGAPLTVRIMSMYNTDCICPACKKKETERADYKQAVDADQQAVLAGNYNFEGVGYNE